MGFSINIFDTKNLEADTIVELAKKGSVRQLYIGSDDKMENIIGSSQEFTMRAPANSIAQFKHLYTYDERRYLVTKNDSETGALLWQGYLLPEQFDEPYTANNPFVRFTASDGLATLKNQFLADSDYEGEFSISQVLQKCLALTGIEAELYVNPAIVNVSGKRWDQQFIYLGKYVDDKGEQKTAWDILSGTLSDLLCTLFQDQGRWYVYGYNKRGLISGSYWVFDSAGDYIRTDQYSKKVKNLIYTGIPRVGINTPKRVIKARHKLIANAIEEESYKVENPGYAVTQPVDLINHKWIYTDVDFTAEFNTNDGRVFLSPVGGSYDPSLSVQLRKQLLFVQGEKIQWDFEFTSAYSGTESWGNSVEDLVVNGDWDKILIYEIFYTDPSNGSEVILYSNQNGPTASDQRYQVPFDRDRKGSLTIQMVVPETAYYNIRFYRPISTAGDIKTDKIYLDRIEVAAIATTDEKLYQDIIPETYTQGIDLELSSHDDLKDFQNIIRLEALGATGDVYDTETRNGISTFTQDGKYYISVTLADAMRIREHIDTVSISGDPVRIIQVLFNFPSDNQNAVEYDRDLLGREIVSGAEFMTIQLRKLADAPTGISDWVQWADGVYQNSYKRYGAAVVEILRNLYQTPHLKIQAVAVGIISMRDLLAFDYDGEKVFYPTDLQIGLDVNRSALQLSQNMYGQAVTTNLPPTVDAGPDLVISAVGSTANLSATASDPEGNIASILWEVISGDGNPIIADPNSLNTTISNLTGDRYVIRITVTDDVGLFATDEVVITRAVNYTLQETVLVDSNNYPPNDDDPDYEYSNKQFEYRVDPNLPEGTRIRFTFDVIIKLETPKLIAGMRPRAVFSVVKKDFTGGQGFVRSAFFDAGRYTVNLEVGPQEGFMFFMNVSAFNSAKFGSVYPNVANKVYAFIQVDITHQFVSGSGTLLGLPIQKTNEARE